MINKVRAYLDKFFLFGIFCSQIFDSRYILAVSPHNWQIGFQTPSSDIMIEINKFHNFLLIIISGIVGFVMLLIIYSCYKFYHKRNKTPAKFSDNLTLELIWTIIPSIILVIISFPSFRLLKLIEEVPPADFTIKVIGHQWYWSYEYPDHEGLAFDSYMVETSAIKDGELRLLEVDNRIYIPKGSVIKFIITATDVIHSFTLPALGIKTDAVPGRINETWTRVDQTGVFYGQCSELCGINHGFMPIVLEVLEKQEFEQWLEKNRK